MDSVFQSFSVEERSQVAFLKREIHNHLLQSSFSKGRIAETDIIVAELSSNLIKHAQGGELLFRLMKDETNPSIELVTIDTGPGIADVTRMMKDGVSTTNTLGHGLGAIQRLSSEFHIYSLPNWGTVSYAVVHNKEPRPKNALEIKALVIPKPPEQVSGDGYLVRQNKNNIKVFMGDGLGHGPYAYEAVKKAADFFALTEENDPVDIIREMHDSVRKTRGLVATIAVLDIHRREWKICGVGNIATRLYGGLVFKTFMAYNGIIGLNIPRSMSSSIFAAEKNQQLIMCSDGLRTRWDLVKYPSILKFDSMVLAAAIYKDFNRRTDDSSVVVAKVNFDR